MVINMYAGMRWLNSATVPVGSLKTAPLQQAHEIFFVKQISDHFKQYLSFHHQTLAR